MKYCCAISALLSSSVDSSLNNNSDRTYEQFVDHTLSTPRLKLVCSRIVIFLLFFAILIVGIMCYIFIHLPIPLTILCLPYNSTSMLHLNITLPPCNVSVHMQRYGYSPIALCQFTCNTMSVHLQHYVSSLVTLCLFTYRIMSVHSQHYVSSPMALCQFTYYAMSVHLLRYVCSPATPCLFTCNAMSVHLYLYVCSPISLSLFTCSAICLYTRSTMSAN